MFKEVFLFEIKRALKRPAIYFYWLVIFAFAFFLMNVAGGAFKSINMNISGDNIKVNAPGTLDIIFGIFSYIGIFIIVAVVNKIVITDFKYDTLSILFTSRIKKHQYIFGRFSAAYFINLLIFTGVGIGIFVGTQMPYLKPDLFGEFMWSAYLNPYLVRIIPNVLLVTSLFFVMSLLLRNVLVNWLSILGLYVLYAVSQGIMQAVETRTLAALLDPFGMAASLVVSTGSSASDMNNETVSLESVYLYNRILWTCISFAILALGYFRFKFSYILKPVFNRTEKVKLKTELEESYGNLEKKKKPVFNLSFSKQSIFKMLRHLVSFEFRGLTKNIYFVLISIISVVFLIVSSKAIGEIYGTDTYPVTYHVIDILGGSMSLFIYIIIILFSGEMIWRDRDIKMSELSNSLPTPRWISLGSKMIALAISVAMLLMVLIGFGISYQLIDGFYNIKISQYFTSIFGMQYINYLLFIVLAFFVQIAFNNKYFAYIGMIVYMVWHSQFGKVIIQHNLFIFRGAPAWSFSDIDSYGYSVWPYWMFTIYWIFFAGILVVLSNLLWNNHKETSISKRIQILKNRVTKQTQISLATLFVLFIVSGSYIYYNTNILNYFERSYSKEKQQAEYERLYKKYEGVNQPKITDIKINGDIYPDKGKLFVKGEYWLKNSSDKSIDSLHIMQNEYIKSVNFGYKSELVHGNDDLDYFIYQLEKPLMPNDSVQMFFEFVSEPKGFTNSGIKSIVHRNGTFFDSNYFPGIGYNSGAEIFSKKVREKHGLVEKQVALEREDDFGRNHNFISHSADFITFEAIISTKKNQTALAPGDLINKWEENNRSYFHYKMPIPMINYFSVLSAEYEIKEEIWTNPATGKEIKLAVYHDADHDFNLESFLNSAKVSLEYYSENLAPYKFDHLKIVEFPRYAQFAQSFPGMIPFSESIGFVADLRELKDGSDSTSVDYPFFFTAHEIAHQWWAHQVVAADVEGSQMLMESITHYCAMKVLEKEYGKEAAKLFVRDETLTYLNSRKNEPYVERPLSKVADYQSWLYYQKGGVLLKALDGYLEDDKLISIMSELVNKFAFKQEPYATTLDFLNLLEKETPDSLKYYTNDIFNKITFYDNDVREASFTRNDDLEYFVIAKIEGEKFYSDGNGKDEVTDMNDWIEVGIYTKDNEEVYLEKIKLTGGENEYQFKLDRKPDKIVIDPYYRVMDKDFARERFDVKKVTE